MSSYPCSWTIGVEEELQIIDPETRGLYAGGEQVLKLIQPLTGTTFSPEIQRCQIELATPICQTLSDVRTALLHARHALHEAAVAAHLHIAASGTHPFSHWKEQQLTARPRYQQIVQRYQQLAREQVIFGCHVHVSYPSREEAIQIMNRARLWLAPILALTTNSPFWLGEDTGYASFRMPLWWRWPLSGPPPYCSSAADYDALLQMLVTTECIEDATHLYWDIRLSQRYPTLEFRCMDVCLTVDEAVMVAGLIRAVVQTVSEQAHQHEPYPLPPAEELRMAQWQAARYGLSAELLDVTRAQVVPAQDQIEHFLTVLHPVLVANGEWEEISSLVHAVLQQGTGATRQRAIYQQTGNLEHVVDFVVTETVQTSTLERGQHNANQRGNIPGNQASSHETRDLPKPDEGQKYQVSTYHHR